MKRHWLSDWIKKQYHGQNGLNRHLQSIPSYSNSLYIVSAAHGTFSKIVCILGLKANLNKYFKKWNNTLCPNRL
jgi:hypothetical protein